MIQANAFALFQVLRDELVLSFTFLYVQSWVLQRPRRGGPGLVLSSKLTGMQLVDTPSALPPRPPCGKHLYSFPFSYTVTSSQGLKILSHHREADSAAHRTVALAAVEDRPSGAGDVSVFQPGNWYDVTDYRLLDDEADDMGDALADACANAASECLGLVLYGDVRRDQPVVRASGYSTAATGSHLQSLWLGERIANARKASAALACIGVGGGCSFEHCCSGFNIPQWLLNVCQHWLACTQEAAASQSKNPRRTRKVRGLLALVLICTSSAMRVIVALLDMSAAAC